MTVPHRNPVRHSPGHAPMPFTIEAVVAAYLHHCAIVGTHCPDSRAEREATLGLFVKSFGHLEVADCRPYHLTDWIEGHARWKSGSTRKAKANQINAVFNWALRDRRIDANPFAAVRYEESEPRQPMPDCVLDQIFLRSNKRFERAARFLRWTWVRLSELCRLTWPDVDLERGEVTMQRHKTRRKTGKPRRFVLLPEMIELLAEIRREQGPDYMGVIFLNNRNHPWTRGTLGQQLRRMKARGQIATTATLHGIRHQGATVSLSHGSSLLAVSKQLGHSSTQITESIYSHVEATAQVVRDATAAGVPHSPS